MAQDTSASLEHVLEQIAAKERASRRRILTYTIVPIAIVAAFLLYSSRQINELSQVKRRLEQDIERSEKELSEAQAKIQTLQREEGHLRTKMETLIARIEELEGPLSRERLTEAGRARAVLVPGVKDNEGRQIYDFVVYLSAPSELKAQIDRVEYYFQHPSILVPRRVATDADSGFTISYRGWGCMQPVKVVVYFFEGEPLIFDFDMCEALGQA